MLSYIILYSVLLQFFVSLIDKEMSFKRNEKRCRNSVTKSCIFSFEQLHTYFFQETKVSRLWSDSQTFYKVSGIS